MDTLPSTSQERCKDKVRLDGPTPDEHLQNRKCHIGHLEGEWVLVKDKASMKALYCKGFYGKGTMSKAAPRVCRPQQPKNGESVKPAFHQSDSDDPPMSDCTDSDDSDDDTDKKYSKEALQLSLMEAYYLSYSLECLVVMDKDRRLNPVDMWRKFCDLMPGAFPYLYTAYQHLRNREWIVRSGTKYNVDYLLYKSGPCYDHSSVGVIVLPMSRRTSKEIPGIRNFPLTMGTMIAKYRILNQASKGLMVFYVFQLLTMSDSQITLPTCVPEFKVEAVYVMHGIPQTSRGEENFG